jgi:hypothetical protein
VRAHTYKRVWMEGEQVFEQGQGVLQSALPCRLCRILGYRDPSLHSPHLSDIALSIEG